MALKLFELCGEDPERAFSPFCWRTRMALAHKGLEAQLVPWRYSETGALKAYGSAKVPVLVDDNKIVSDSWAIAIHLDDDYVGRPSLLGGDSGRAFGRLINWWCDTSVMSAIFPLIAADIASHLGPEDAAYFRRTREAHLGRSLEAARDARETEVAAFRKALNPVRLTLKSQPFIGGAAANYGDYILFGVFQWARTVSPFELITKDDLLYAWREKLLDAFDGLARNAVGYPV